MPDTSAIVIMITLGNICSTYASGPRKFLKQIVDIKLNRVESPNWPKANQVVIYKRGRGYDFGTTENKFSTARGKDKAGP